MKRALLVLLVLLTPATADAATVGREGSELVYRSAPGQEDLFEARLATNVLTFAGREGGEARITPGAGCTLARKVVRCPVDGVTAVRVFAGDSDDQISFYRVPLPLFVDLGPGSDDFAAIAPALTVTGGEGSDMVDFEADAGTIDLGPGEDLVGMTILKTFVGPLTIEGGDGPDLFSVGGRSKAGIALSGGPGNDEFNLLTTGPGLDVACGPGDDVTRLGLADRPGTAAPPTSRCRTRGRCRVGSRPRSPRVRPARSSSVAAARCSRAVRSPRPPAHCNCA